MTRLFLNYFVSTAIFCAAGFSALAADDLVKSSVLENDVLYLRVGEVGKNLADEITSAQSALSATNKIAGTILDLRFAVGDNLDWAKAPANLFAAKKLPLAILINSGTSGAAAKLATDLRETKSALFFGSAVKDLQPDISISVKSDDEKKFMENPFGTLAQTQTNSAASTNDFLSFVDHTTEADLVREKIKDGKQDENSQPVQTAEQQKPFIRDPVLARGVDFIKGLAALHLSHS